MKMKPNNRLFVNMLRTLGELLICSIQIEAGLHISEEGSHMNFAEVKECPKCGGKEIGKGKHSGYAVMYPESKMSLGSEIEYILCTRCGYIIESYVKKPEKFKRKNY